LHLRVPFSIVSESFCMCNPFLSNMTTIMHEALLCSVYLPLAVNILLIFLYIIRLLYLRAEVKLRLVQVYIKSIYRYFWYVTSDSKLILTPRHSTLTFEWYQKHIFDEIQQNTSFPLYSHIWHAHPNFGLWNVHH
jgi:hypothetical protein